MDKFENVTDNIKIENNIISFYVEKASSFHMLNMGNFDNVKNFASLHRQVIFWQNVKTGTEINEIPPETQWLLLQYNDDSYGIIIPLVIEPYRCALRGKDNNIYIYCETGDPAIEVSEGIVAYFEKGTNPYELMRNASKRIASVLPDLRIRDDKNIPEFINYFGWCTWDSFYQDVTADGVKSGLEDFKKGGVVPGLLILDDGWQGVADENGYKRLTSFKPNEKFDHSLKSTVKMAKDDFGVKLFMVWHAMMGYWKGVSVQSAEMKEYDVKLKMLALSDTMYEINPEFCDVLAAPNGVVNPKKAFEFYNDYHSLLMEEGVDGVKVDVQSAVETMGTGDGGAVSVIKSFRKGLEASVDRNFKGNLINCMSCSNCHIFNTLSGAVMRSSDDFYPDKPESHGNHILINAFSSMFMGEFLVCDWDMFQTQHEYGKFHAASRAISGSPIYVSDKVGEHDFDLIDKLTMADSMLPLCKINARPTADCLFTDSEQKDTLFKIFNYNNYTGVVGAFNLRSDISLSGIVSPLDIDGNNSGKYAVYDMKSDKLLKADYNEKIECVLDAIDFNIYTVTEISDGFAPIGLINKFNCGGTITELEKNGNTVSMTVGDGGNLLMYSEKKPEKVLVNNEEHKFDYADCSLNIRLPKGQVNKVYIVF